MIDTPDDDFLELDLLEKQNSKPVVILFHGLEGNTKRYYMTRLAREISIRGYTVAMVNFRGCGDKLNRQRRFYHSGETSDIDTIINWISSQYPNKPIYSAGFSLGASVLFNYLKENGKHQPIEKMVAISTPFELKKGSQNLDKGFNKVYSVRFIKMLVEKLEKKRKYYPDLPNFTGKTLYDFDNQVTAPLHGFRDADDYYDRCSSYYFMDKIATNSLIIHSKEDPLTPFQWTPVKEIQNNPKLIPCFTEKGGHVGFWGKPEGWLNKTIADYFDAYESNGRG
ncbi:MAG: alpha/beta fold hydrolase [Balneolaceae bacterium]